MKYTIELREEQEAALARCDWSLQDKINELLVPVIQSMNAEKIQRTYEAVQSDEELKAAVESKLSSDNI